MDKPPKVHFEERLFKFSETFVLQDPTNGWPCFTQKVSKTLETQLAMSESAVNKQVVQGGYCVQQNLFHYNVTCFLRAICVVFQLKYYTLKDGRYVMECIVMRGCKTAYREILVNIGLLLDLQTMLGPPLGPWPKPRPILPSTMDNAIVNNEPFDYLQSKCTNTRIRVWHEILRDAFENPNDQTIELYWPYALQILDSCSNNVAKGTAEEELQQALSWTVLMLPMLPLEHKQQLRKAVDAMADLSNETSALRLQIKKCHLYLRRQLA